MGAGAGAATPSPSVLVSSSIKVAVASLVLSWWAPSSLDCLYLHSAVGWPKVVWRPAVAQIWHSARRGALL